MSQLARHIEYLLLEHDRVAVPGLGTFVCHNVPLHLEEGAMFCVPRRDVSMIAEADDDGLLAAHVSRENRCTAGESHDIICRWVEECRLEVHECGVCDLEALGQLVLEGEEIVFQPCTAGLTSPEFFGLDNLEMPVLPLLATQIKEAVERAEEKEEKEVEQPSSKHIVIRLNRNLVHYAASIAAALILFFAFTTPTTHSTMSSDEASFIPGFFVPTESQNVNNDETIAVEETADEPVEKAKEEVVEKVKEEAKVQPSTGYAVVVASSIKKVNAEAMVERLRSRGIEGAQVFIHNDMTRVAFLGYSTREEAIAAASKLRTRDEELSGAWVFEIK